MTRRVYLIAPFRSLMHCIAVIFDPVPSHGSAVSGSSGRLPAAGVGEETVQNRLEARCQQLITKFAKMQPIGGDRHAELPVAVE